MDNNEIPKTQTDAPPGKTIKTNLDSQLDNSLFGSMNVQGSVKGLYGSISSMQKANQSGSQVNMANCGNDGVLSSGVMNNNQLMSYNNGFNGFMRSMVAKNNGSMSFSFLENSLGGYAGITNQASQNNLNMSNNAAQTMNAFQNNYLIKNGLNLDSFAQQQQNDSKTSQQNNILFQEMLMLKNFEQNQHRANNLNNKNINNPFLQLGITNPNISLNNFSNKNGSLLFNSTLPNESGVDNGNSHFSMLNSNGLNASNIAGSNMNANNNLNSCLNAQQISNPTLSGNPTNPTQANNDAINNIAMQSSQNSLNGLTTKIGAQICPSTLSGQDNPQNQNQEDPKKKNQQQVKANMKMNTSEMLENTQDDDLMAQMKAFYSQRDEGEEKTKKSTIKAEEMWKGIVSVYAQEQRKGILERLEEIFTQCKMYVEAIYSAESEITASQSWIDFQEVQEKGEILDEAIRGIGKTLIGKLKTCLEDVLWQHSLSELGATLKKRKSLLSPIVLTILEKNKFEFLSPENEVERFPKYYTSQLENPNSNNHLKFNFFDCEQESGVLEDLSTSSVFIGLKHKQTQVKKGRGMIFMKDGSVFEGYFAQDKPNGQGRLLFTNGNVYQGLFQDGLQHGKGKYTWTSGNIYEGDFAMGIRQGRGKFTWADGRIYEGYCSNDVPNGFGEYSNCVFSKSARFPHTFEIYKGNWKNNKKNGKGILFVGMQAEWKDNNLVKIEAN